MDGGRGCVGYLPVADAVWVEDTSTKLPASVLVEQDRVQDFGRCRHTHHVRLGELDLNYAKDTICA